MTTQAPIFGHAVDEDGPNRRLNHLATAADLAAITTCAICASQLPQDERYLCSECSESGLALADAQIALQRAKQAADGTGWRMREPFDPFDSSSFIIDQGRGKIIGR